MIFYNSYNIGFKNLVIHQVHKDCLYHHIILVLVNMLAWLLVAMIPAESVIRPLNSLSQETLYLVMKW